jgi:hypothetical protein
VSFEFIKQLNESSLIRNTKALKSFNARDIADLIFLYFLALQILRNDFESNPEAADYANRTNMWSSIDEFRNSGTDLYILMHTLFGSNNKSALNMLDNQHANNLLLQNLQFDYPQAKKWLMNISAGNEETPKDKQFLMKLESMLLIKNGDYRAIRRLVQDWNDLDQQAKALTMTRLLMALRARAKRSELLPFLEKTAKNNKLEIQGVKNPEVSEPDKKHWKGAAIGAAIGGAIVANSIRKFVLDAGKGKKLN